MSFFKRICHELPEMEKSVLLYWENSGHMEDGYLYRADGFQEPAPIFHCLFDGETLNDDPSHWMPLPEVPK